MAALNLGDRLKTDKACIEMRGITVNRNTLLVAIDRHCIFADCNARVSVGLTKAESMKYLGFECTRCKRWNEDVLAQHDIPEWWDELNSTGFSLESDTRE